MLTSQAPVQPRRKTQSGKQAVASKPTTRDDDFFRSSKRDKRQIKHASFVSKIEKNSQNAPKRRRASKKLATNLESLASALPDTAAELDEPTNQVNIIKQKTLRHKPGAVKRKQQIEKTERDRFAKNMAQLSSLDSGANPESNAGQTSSSNRWAALRNFVSQTMEQQPVFQTNKGA